MNTYILANSFVYIFLENTLFIIVKVWIILNQWRHQNASSNAFLIYLYIYIWIYVVKPHPYLCLLRWQLGRVAIWGIPPKLIFIWNLAFFAHSIRFIGTIITELRLDDGDITMVLYVKIPNDFGFLNKNMSKRDFMRLVLKMSFGDMLYCNNRSIA